jgi:protein gp37
VSFDSLIEWTHSTFNPWWGCVKVSPGCEHCYAESAANRYGHHVWGSKMPRRFFSDEYWAKPLKWNAAAAKLCERHRVFCASMADVFEDRRDLDIERAKLWRLIEQTPALDWLLLTKRPENMPRLLPGVIGRNMWLGTTVEDVKRKERIDILRNVPAFTRFLSVEPLLEDLGALDLRGIDWVIVGGESGHGARPMNEDWVRSIRDQCVSAGVRFFYKQKIEQRKKVSLPVLDGRQWVEVPR